MTKSPILRYKDYRELDRRLAQEVDRLRRFKGLDVSDARMVALENLSRTDVKEFFAVMRKTRGERQED